MSTTTYLVQVTILVKAESREDAEAQGNLAAAVIAPLSTGAKPGMPSAVVGVETIESAQRLEDINRWFDGERE